MEVQNKLNITKQSYMLNAGQNSSHSFKGNNMDFKFDKNR